MKLNVQQLRGMIRGIIQEVKKEKEGKVEKLPQSSGKLIDLKKELVDLRKMKEELQTAKFAEKTAETEVEFANLQKFSVELDKIKQGGIELEQKLDQEIANVEQRINDEKIRIKEMIGLIPSGDQKKIEDSKKPSAGLSVKKKSSIEKRAHAGKDIGKGNFGKVAATAAKEYGSKEAGEKVAGAAMWKNVER